MNGTTSRSRQLRSREKKDDSEMSETSSVGGEADDMATASHYLSHTRVGAKRKEHMVTVQNSPKKRRKDDETDEVGELQDVYCWECHRECVEGALDCHACPRTFHPACLIKEEKEEEKTPENWICPVCQLMKKAESGEGKSLSIKDLTREQLNTLLSYAHKRMKHSEVKSEPFQHPVPMALVPDYYDLVFHPMDLATMEKKLKRQAYGSSDEFLEDVKWISHNSIIFNGASSKYSGDAKLIIKICKHEISELELCPDCYRQSTLRPQGWFANPCGHPHCLVWAKLKGFPFWPGKVLRVSSQNNVDVRFFGEYDRAWIPMRDCYVLSKESPQPSRNPKKHGLDKAMDELNDHIKNLKAKFGVFHYAPIRKSFKPEHMDPCPLLNSQEPELEGSESGRSSMTDESSNKTLNGVFTMDDSLNEQLAEAGNRLEENSDISSTSLLPNEESIGILERLQDSLSKETDDSLTVAKTDDDIQSTSSPVAGGSTNNKDSNKDTPTAGAARKRNLDMLLEKMHVNKTTPPINKSTSDDSPKPKAPVNASNSKPSVDEIIQKHSLKMSENLKSAFEDLTQELNVIEPSNPNVSANITGDCKDHATEILNLRLSLNKLKWKQTAAVAEIKHSNKVALNEMKATFEMEKQRQIGEVIKKMENDKFKAVAATKIKQWCAFCGKEAVFYCCWNTSYCDYPCQQQHWAKHQGTCAQIRGAGGAPNAQNNNDSQPTTQNSQVVYQIPAQAGGQVVPVYAAGLPSQGYIAVAGNKTTPTGITLIQTAANAVTRKN